MERVLNRKIIIPFLFICWGVTLLFRMQYLDKLPPVNNVAHIFMLQTMKIWQQESALKSNFAMKQTFPDKGNKFVTYYKRYMDLEGNNYYVSHPSLSQFIVWAISFAGKYNITNRTLVWLAMIFQLVAAVFLVLLFREILNLQHYSLTAEIVLVVIYIFHPMVLYMNTFHFFAETVGQSMFLLTAFLFAKYIKSGFSNSTTGFILLCVSSFFFTSAEWLGLIFAFTPLVFLLISFRKHKHLLQPTMAMIIGAIVSVSLFFIQHVTLHNTQLFLRALGIRFLERSGFFGNDYTDMGYSYLNPESYLLLLKQVLEVFRGTGILFFIPVIIVFLSKKPFRQKLMNEKTQLLMIISAACAIHMFLLFSATVSHYIYMAKWTVPLVLTTALIFSQRDGAMIVRIRKFVVIILLTTAVWSVVVFQKKAGYLEKPDAHLIRYSEYIAAESEDNIPVFCAPMPSYHRTAEIWLSYASGKNIRTFEKEEGICKFQQPRPHEYHFFSANANGFHKTKGTCSNSQY